MVPATGGPGPAGGTPRLQPAAAGDRAPFPAVRRNGRRSARRYGPGAAPLPDRGPGARGGGVCAGVHLEASPQNIAECAGAGTVPVRGPGYRTLCDPRLNMRQAVAVAAHWQQGLSPARPAVRAANP
ncbi:MULTISPECIES: 3-deoxy-7-phosphoheptulonate synthase [Streptomyces]|uniref:3-deoxy-7-phosphoheptulonate synthase n=1 Tax=Streptomyces TaxID=1883 RepID=UPI000D1C8E68|nr:MULTISPECIES: 3-deoxy-7-phosphoheptulonate synthase [unclassified Streptomyces]